MQWPGRQRDASGQASPEEFTPTNTLGLLGMLCVHREPSPVLVPPTDRGCLVEKNPYDALTSAHLLMQPLHLIGRAPPHPILLREDQHWTHAVLLPPHCANQVVSKN